MVISRAQHRRLIKAWAWFLVIVLENFDRPSSLALSTHSRETTALLNLEQNCGKNYGVEQIG